MVSTTRRRRRGRSRVAAAARAVVARRPWFEVWFMPEPFLQLVRVADLRHRLAEPEQPGRQEQRHEDEDRAQREQPVFGQCLR